jgi:acyl-CoA reductase-like NAD-dependent aldehyde dehydrogenase
MSKTKTNTTEERELTQEEIDAQRKNMVAFYKDQEEYLSLVLKHEEIKASISKARAERIMYDIRIAQMLAGPQDQGQEDSPEESPEGSDFDIDKKPRTLKKK